MRRITAILALAASCAFSAPGAAQQLPDPGTRPFVGHQVHRVTVSTPEQLEAIENLAVTIWSCDIGVGPIDAQFRPEDLARLDQLGIPHVLRIPDVQAVLDAEREQLAAARVQADIAWFSTFRNLDEINAKLDALAAAHPDVASTFVAGQSLELRDIRGIRFSSPDLPNNPRNQRPIVFLNGTQHAREWIAPMTAMYCAETLLESSSTDTHIQSLLDKVEFIIVPVVNVDGYVYTWASTNNRMWRKNRRHNADGTFGVDNNRNFSFRWGHIGASPSGGNETFRGAGPASEPETQVITALFNANPRIVGHIDFHSYANLILSPWGFTALPCPDQGAFAPINASMQSAINSVAGLTFGAGPSYTTIYPTSGSITDFSYGSQHNFSWCIELRGDGFVISDDQILPGAREGFAGALTVADHVISKPLWIESHGGPCQAHLVPWISSPNGLPEIVNARQPATIHIEVRNGSGQLASNPTLYTRVPGGGDFMPAAMAPGIGTEFTGSLPPTGPGRMIEYYVEAQTRTGQIVRYPAAGLFSVPAYDIATLFSDDMESNTGWTVGLPTDNATGGIWERGTPGNTPAQVGYDVSANGTNCWVTDPDPNLTQNANDVDGGTTTLTSPVINGASGPGFVRTSTQLTYYRWYSNDIGSNPRTDSMPITISYNNGGNFSALETVTVNAGDWVRKTWNIASPTSTMKVRFAARDTGSDATVEAAIDEVSLIAIGVQRSSDFDGDGDFGTDADIESFFRCLAGNCCPACYSADFDSDGDTGTDADIESFFRCLAGTC